jgi:circadian clock protein KaiB
MTAAAPADRWSLTLYVDGASTSSIHAIETVRRICDNRLGDCVDLEVIDVHLHPELAAGDQIVAVPTLVRRSPGPPRTIVGGFGDVGLLSIGLDLAPANDGDVRPGQDADPGQ